MFKPKPHTLASMKKDPRLMRVFQSKIPPVVVFPVSHAVGISVVRTLQGQGIPVLAVDFKPQAAALYSRHATPLLLPDLYVNQETFAQGMLELGACFSEKPVLFLVDDEDLFLSLKRSEEFEKVYRLPISHWPIVEPIVDKGQLYRNMQRAGFPIPVSWFPKSRADLDALRSELIFPCIVKPTYSMAFRQRFGVKAKRFDNFDDLANFLPEILKEGFDFVVQEYIPGEAGSLYTYVAYSDDNGEVMASFTGRKLHQFPPDFGTCRLGESVEDAELERLGVLFLRLLRFKGISLTEYKRDTDGSFKLIELNPRPGDWPERLAQLCGANVVLAAYRHAIGQKLARCRANRVGVKWVHLAEDFYYCVRGYKLLGYPEEHRGLFRWLRDMKGVETSAFFAWDDPLPSLVRFRGMWRDFMARERELRS